MGFDSGSDDWALQGGNRGFIEGAIAYFREVLGDEVAAEDVLEKRSTPELELLLDELKTRYYQRPAR